VWSFILKLVNKYVEIPEQKSGKRRTQVDRVIFEAERLIHAYFPYFHELNTYNIIQK
jgi:hypothetical protein